MRGVASVPTRQSSFNAAALRGFGIGLCICMSSITELVILYEGRVGMRQKKLGMQTFRAVRRSASRSVTY